MYFRFASLLPVAALAAVVVAAPSELKARDSECTTGTAQCCDVTGTENDPAVSNSLGSLGLLGVVLGPIDAILGLQCIPIGVIALQTAADCTQQPVCCTDTAYEGLINIGCTPINVAA